MAWCRQATSHYLSQCWPRSLSPYGVTRPQWVNSLVPRVPCGAIELGTIVGKSHLNYKMILKFNSLWPSNAISSWSYGDIDLSQRWLVMAIAWQHHAITWTNVDFWLVRFCSIHQRVISQWVMGLKIIHLKLLQHFPRSNELKSDPHLPEANDLSLQPQINKSQQ